MKIDEISDEEPEVYENFSGDSCLSWQTGHSHSQISEGDSSVSPVKDVGRQTQPLAHAETRPPGKQAEQLDHGAQDLIDDIVRQFGHRLY